MMRFLKLNGALRISIIYIILAGIWITFSDMLLGWLISDAHVIARVSLYKGWFFIAVTASVLFITMERELAYRRQIEDDIRKLNADLERRVEERTAQLSAAYDELDLFTSSVSHDLRAPLRSINGYSQLLLEDYGELVGENGRKRLTMLHGTSRRMAETMDALLQFSRLARVKLDERELDLSQIATEVAADLQSSTPERQVDIVIQPGLTAVADPALMRIVLANLLQNAWKFTAHKQDARIEFLRGQRDGMPVFLVRDNGVGFDMAQAARLFQPFQRLHAESEYSGTGIGLALVQRIIRRHDGEIWASGRPGSGAEFSFVLKK
jgi:light-regulated signal transduction histidine kinase (bacteriophytochrome)